MSTPLFASPEQIMNEKNELAREGIKYGRDVAALEYAGGIAIVAQNASRTLYKISEIYDRVAFAAVGSVPEYDLLRTVGIEQAELKGFTYSREDVTGRWLSNLYSQYIGNVWRQFDAKPFEVELIVAELGEPGYAQNQLYRISYNGVLRDAQRFCVIGGKANLISAWLDDNYEPGLTLHAAVRLAADAIQHAQTSDEEPISSGGLEAAFLEESRGRRKFRRAQREELAEALGENSASNSAPNDGPAGSDVD